MELNWIGVIQSVKEWKLCFIVHFMMIKQLFIQLCIALIEQASSIYIYVYILSKESNTHAHTEKNYHTVVNSIKANKIPIFNKLKSFRIE